MKNILHKKYNEDDKDNEGTGNGRRDNLDKYRNYDNTN